MRKHYSIETIGKTIYETSSLDIAKTYMKKLINSYNYLELKEYIEYDNYTITQSIKIVRR